MSRSAASHLLGATSAALLLRYRNISAIASREDACAIVGPVP
jgi:hypothetical protein